MSLSATWQIWMLLARTAHQLDRFLAADDFLQLISSRFGHFFRLSDFKRAFVLMYFVFVQPSLA